MSAAPSRTVAARAPIALWEAGEGSPVLLLHGFPDHAPAMLPLAERIAATGRRVLVPALPGYHPSGAVADDDYSVSAVASDLIAVLDALGIERAAVVGHDWGGLVAYHLGAAHPRRTEAVVAMSVPHPDGFRIRRRILREQQTAVYAWMLAYAGNAAELAADPDWLAQLVHLWSPGLRRDDWPELLDVLTRPEVARAVVRWYHCDLEGLGDPTGDVLVPATVIHGMQDGCIGPATYEGLESRFAAGVARHALASVGHWPHLEDPAQTLELVLDGLTAAGAGRP